MHKNTFLKIIVFICVSLTLNLTAFAQPTIEWADYYTDCWYDNPFGSDRCHEVVCAYVEGPESKQVFVQVIDETPGHYKSINLTSEGNWYCRFVENDGFVSDILLIRAWYQGPINIESSEKYTNTLDNIIWMDEADNISISDFSTSPLVSWDAETDVTRYYLRVLDSSNNEIHRSPPLDLPEYKIPSDVLTTYHQYYFRLLNQNYDDCFVYPWGQCLENRSSTWIGFTPILSDDIKEWIENGGLEGTGDGPQADRRLNAFVNMLNNAAALFQDSDIEGACDQLEAASRKCDGEPRPPDFVEGTAAADMILMIESLMTDFGCE